MNYTYNPKADYQSPVKRVNYGQSIQSIQAEITRQYGISNGDREQSYINQFSSSSPVPIYKEELQVLKSCGVKSKNDLYSYLGDISRATAKWACITSKTQRAQNDRWLLEVYENVTKLKPYIENVSYQEPPDRTGEKISRFSKKSRSRMMDRFRKMKKSGLSLPFFVTLTYHRNEMRGDIAKKHLNTFLQRFRRLQSKNDQFRYFWKMEKQKRGAIHFHLMLWVPENVFPEKWNCSEKINGKKETTKQCEYLKLRVSSAWNEIAEPGDNKHLQAGTNCRPGFSWRMCTGYLAKYMEKEVTEKQFQKSAITGGYNPRKRKNYVYWNHQNDKTGFSRLSGKKRKQRVIKVCSTEKITEKPGRFWGFSYNFDFSACFRGETDIKNIDSIKSHLTNIQKTAYRQYIQYEKSEISRIKASNFSEKKKRVRLEKIAERMKNQRRRAIVNIKKIELGAMIQIEVAQKYAISAIKSGPV